MAHASTCAASGNDQGRDEWMTVAEMQEYMRASRNKAYDLIWSGEVDSYRLGRKLLVSRASVDAYIESRSGRRWRRRPPRGPPAAGHAREPRDERSSRATMAKSISRSQVRLIASTNSIFGADEACAMLRISRDAMYRLAKDPDDPFLIRYIGGKTRDGIVLHDELVAWVERNSVVGSPRRG